jgi:hypothetical protein
VGGKIKADDFKQVKAPEGDLEEHGLSPWKTTKISPRNGANCRRSAVMMKGLNSPFQGAEHQLNSLRAAPAVEGNLL